MLARVVDDRALELLGEDVAHHAHRQVGLLEDHGRRGGLLGALGQHLVQLVQVLDLALEVGLLRALGGGADDGAAVAELEALGGLAQPVALLVVQAPRHADALALGHVDQVAAGDRELHRQARALGLERVLDGLDQDLLAGLEQLGDALALAAGAPAAGHLDAGDDHVVGVQEAVLLQADVHERGLEAGKDVVDLALVDVADDRARSAPLDVQLAYAPVGSLPLSCRPCCRAVLAVVAGLSGGRALRLEDGDTGFATVGRDEYLLSQKFLS